MRQGRRRMIGRPSLHDRDAHRNRQRRRGYRQRRCRMRLASAETGVAGCIVGIARMTGGRIAVRGRAVVATTVGPVGAVSDRETVVVMRDRRAIVHRHFRRDRRLPIVIAIPMRPRHRRTDAVRRQGEAEQGVEEGAEDGHGGSVLLGSGRVRRMSR